MNSWHRSTKREVLLIDLDPQTNATVSLIDQKDWETRDKAGKTLFQLFNDKLQKTSKFDINESIIHKVSNVGGGIENLDLFTVEPSINRYTGFYSHNPNISLF